MSAKLRKKARRETRIQVYDLIAALLRGPEAQSVADKLYAALPDTMPILETVQRREYAVEIVAELASEYTKRAEYSRVLDEKASRPVDDAADGPTYDHPDTPAAHSPCRGHDA